MKRITVLGAGNGGQTLSAHLTLMGHSVKLFEHPDFAESVQALNKKGGIELYGSIEGFARLELITTNMEEAIRDTEIIYLVAPSFAQTPIMRMCIPYLETGMKIILIPGNFGSLEILKILKEDVPGLDVTLAETDTLPYACRMDEPGKVNVWGYKKGLSIAALPGNRTRALIKEISDCFPIELRPSDNVLEVAFSNLNMIVHCSTMLLNVGRIESTRGDFRFYTDGVTPSVGKLQEEMDRERIKVGRAYDMGLVKAIDWIRSIYPVAGESMYELLSGNPIYARHGADAPKTVIHRYVTEDVPYLLVPVDCLGEASGISSPVIRSVITLLSTITGKNFLSEGRNLEKLGLKGLTPGEIRDMVRGHENSTEGRGAS